MNHTIILLVIVFLALYFGYPKYEEYRFVEEVREQIRTGHTEMPEFTGLPIKATLTEDYPLTLMTFHLTDLAYHDLSPAIKIQLRKQIKAIPCRNLHVFEEASQAYVKALTQVYEEDNKMMKIMLRDKHDEYIMDHSQLISECSQFSELKRKSL